MNAISLGDGGGAGNVEGGERRADPTAGVPAWTVADSIEALKRATADRVVRPLDSEQVRSFLDAVAPPVAQPPAKGNDVRTMMDDDACFGLLWGRSSAMRRVYEQVARVAGTAITVFITGESGTGKELVAQTVHRCSRRREHPFLAVNCGAISPHLIESEIFGHEKGSFTGANRQHLGFFERAHGGTLFLDEVTEMPLELQVKLLRVLETGTFMRVGSTEPQRADVRIVAATNRVPEQAVAAGKLREDLLYRLNVFPIGLPPLRERLEDVPLLAEHFLAQICTAEGTAKAFSAQALARMSSYRWPGNVRELRNTVQRAFVMADGPIITDEWLAFEATAPRKVEPGVPFQSVRIGTALEDVERTLILATLEHYNGHREKTAAALGVSLKTLYNRLKKYGSVSDEDAAEAA